MRLTETRPILRLDLEGNLIDEYPFLAEAARHTGVNFSTIYNCLSGQCLRSGCYFFLYKEYYDPKNNYSYRHRNKLRSFKRSLK